MFLLESSKKKITNMHLQDIFLVCGCVRIVSPNVKTNNRGTNNNFISYPKKYDDQYRALFWAFLFLNLI
jgi:hypothetical protein